MKDKLMLIDYSSIYSAVLHEFYFAFGHDALVNAPLYTEVKDAMKPIFDRCVAEAKGQSVAELSKEGAESSGLVRGTKATRDAPARKDRDSCDRESRPTT